MVSYETIRRRHGGDDGPPRLIVHRGQQILALCVLADLHPRIFSRPAEVWIEESGYMEEWADRLANDTGAVLLYVANGPDSQFRPRGIYHVLGSTSDRVDLACRMAESAGRISRVIFLSGPQFR